MDDSALENVTQRARELEQQLDGILWDYGVNDPRIAALATELRHYRDLEARGVVYEPKF